MSQTTELECFAPTSAEANVQGSGRRRCSRGSRCQGNHFDSTSLVAAARWSTPIAETVGDFGELKRQQMCRPFTATFCSRILPQYQNAHLASKPYNLASMQLERAVEQLVGRQQWLSQLRFVLITSQTGSGPLLSSPTCVRIPRHYHRHELDICNRSCRQHPGIRRDHYI